MEVSWCLLDLFPADNVETGWPGDGGSDAGAAKAGTANEEVYWNSAVCGILDWGWVDFEYEYDILTWCSIDLFWFSAFDEPGKADAIGDNGQKASEKFWGAFDQDRKPKFDMKCGR